MYDEDLATQFYERRIKLEKLESDLGLSTVNAMAGTSTAPSLGGSSSGGTLSNENNLSRTLDPVDEQLKSLRKSVKLDASKFQVLDKETNYATWKRASRPRRRYKGLNIIWTKTMFLQVPRRPNFSRCDRDTSFPSYLRS